MNLKDYIKFMKDNEQKDAHIRYLFQDKTAIIIPGYYKIKVKTMDKLIEELQLISIQGWRSEYRGLVGTAMYIFPSNRNKYV